MTLDDFLKWASEYFEQHDLYYGHGTDNAWDEAVMLALYVLQLPAYNDVSILDRKLTATEQTQLQDLAEQRVTKRIPVPYLTHEAWFAGERYYVNEHVLIPRSPCEEIIANHFQPWLGALQPKSILDLCSGSGCIAIYCAKEFPQASVDAADISVDALNVARKNIALHNCIDRVHAIESDLFTALAGKQYDIIISNPPYVGQQEMAELPLEYKHEPVLALESGIEGLDLTVKILQQASQHLTENGLLVVEVGNSWRALEEKYPKVAFTWLEFAHGGEGVFLLTAEYLRTLKL
ncbi:MAG TPA: 50S ribosomal protein L3 N(5)-glutamine methyltransferase [Gammaproteobacteria bacterium]|nr:50S ribosomal protein L3 N(5)-glutamine methyltransferase [Gammaproteobacteria bacterium]